MPQLNNILDFFSESGDRSFLDGLDPRDREKFEKLIADGKPNMVGRLKQLAFRMQSEGQTSGGLDALLGQLTEGHKNRKSDILGKLEPALEGLSDRFRDESGAVKSEFARITFTSSDNANKLSPVLITPQTSGTPESFKYLLQPNLLLR